MREMSSRGNAAGVGSNPMFAWGRFTLQNAANPLLVHGVGMTMARTGTGTWRVTLDPGVKPPAWTAVVQTYGASPLLVASVDEALGRIELTGTDTLNNIQVSVMVMGAGP